MMMKDKLLIAAGAMALLAPNLATAQTWFGGYYGHPGGDYGRYRGYGDYQEFRGYPEFAGEKSHIRQEIREGMYDGWLDRESGYRLSSALRRVDAWEAREFQEHGWDLPYGDRARLKGMLDRLDHEVDEARDES